LLWTLRRVASFHKFEWLQETVERLLRLSSHNNDDIIDRQEDLFQEASSSYMMT